MEPCRPSRAALEPMNPSAVDGHTETETIKMSGSSITRTALLLASLSLAGGAALAAPVSPFIAMAGTWSGGGVLSTTDGQQEQLRCRAAYDVAGAGDQLRLNLTCASASYKFDLASEVEYRGGAIRGSWTEASRNASGTLSGRAAGDHVEAAARGDSFSANLSLTTRGGKQTVSIQPQGTNITSVSLALNRR
jgi:hypothetical protein